MPLQLVPLRHLGDSSKLMHKVELAITQSRSYCLKVAENALRDYATVIFIVLYCIL